jgi:hypothetical protein
MASLKFNGSARGPLLRSLILNVFSEEFVLCLVNKKRRNDDEDAQIPLVGFPLVYGGLESMCSSNIFR